jgi:hypothetical protein
VEKAQNWIIWGGIVDKIDNVALRVYHAVFGNQESVEIEGKRYSINKTPKMGLRIVEA